MKHRALLGAVSGTMVGLGIGLAVDVFPAAGPGGQPVAHASASGAARRVVLSPTLRERAGLTLETVARQPLAPALHLVGSVGFDADAVADVGGRIAGRVTRVLVRQGDLVVPGQPLVEIESSQLGSALAELFAHQAELIAAEQLVAREADLLTKRLTNAASAEQALARKRALQAEIAGAEQLLLAMGVSPAELSRASDVPRPRHITLRAPLAGEVVERHVVLGQVVDPTAPLLRIADLGRVWVELSVYEKDLSRVRIGDAVQVSCNGHPGRTFVGTVGYVEATIDKRTRTANVRVSVDNPERLLRPGQFVEAWVEGQAGARSGLTVARAAVLSIDGSPSVFVAAADGSFVAQPVEVGVTTPQRAEIVRGLREGDRVVVQGAFALKSELVR